jgi:3-oxoacyl-[acyl-carrier protein] reductase
MELGIEGKTALVMAASRGIGKGIAEALAREGARVAIASRSAERLEQAAAEVGEGTVALTADTGDLEELATLPGRVAETLGPVEILVLNTGGPPMGGAFEHDLPTWEDAYRSLVLAPKVLLDAALPGMRERGWGRVVNVGSSSTREPIPFLNLSNAHRMAAVGYLKTLSSEVAADGITVNTVATGRFATERLADNAGSLQAAEEAARTEIPAARLGQPEEYGDLVAFLCSKRAAYITGTVIPIDGGLLKSAG